MIAIDPVCKMKVDTETAQWKYEFQGETYYFCAPGCLRSFSMDPQKYLSGTNEGHEHSHHDSHEHH